MKASRKRLWSDHQLAARLLDRDLGPQHVGLGDLADPKPDLGLTEFVLAQTQGVSGDLHLGLGAQHAVVGPGNAEQDLPDGELIAFGTLSNRRLAQLAGGKKSWLQYGLGDPKNPCPALQRANGRTGRKEAGGCVWQDVIRHKRDLVPIPGIRPLNIGPGREMGQGAPRQQAGFAQFMAGDLDSLLILYG